MPVTELAILRLTTATYEDPTNLFKVLKRAKEVQETASGYPAYYFHQIEDPFYVYIIGSWNSVEDHVAFLPKQENQEVLELVRSHVILSELTMIHIDMNIINSSIFARNFLNVVRYTVDSEPSRARLSTKPIPVPTYAIGGWAIDEELGETLSGHHREEFVLFSGWEHQREVEIPCPGTMFKHPQIVETKHAKRIPLEDY
eukprot:gene10643-12426_t